MYRHGGLNRIYRLVWNESTGAFIPISEMSLKSNKPRSGGVIGSASALVMAAAIGFAPFSHADPTGPAGIAPQHNLNLAPVAPSALPTQGQVVTGQASISESGTHQTISQTTDKVAINWQTFNIGEDSKVTFVQPGANSIALNRVLTNEASQIYGALEANGQVFLINPNGVLFGKGAQVNVGGIVASTRDINSDNFIAGNYKFSGNNTGQIINEGKISAADNGYVVLVGAQVINSGEIRAQQGDVRLAAANEVEIQIQNGGLVNLTTTQGALDALAANGGLIKADGGRIFLTADALDQLAKASVNNTGIIEAQTIVNKNGTIVLLGDEQVGTTHVAGTLDASAPNGGAGGFIETSAAHVTVANGARITTAGDVTGEWLIDPVDFTIAASGGDMTGADLTTALGSTNVTILSTSGASGTEGDVNVNDTVTWSSNILTLNAQADINFNSSVTASGTGSLVLEYGQATTDGLNANYNLANGVKIGLPTGQNFTTKQGSAGVAQVYTVINDLGLAGDMGATTLQGLKGDLDGLFVLGSDIDAIATLTWNPVGPESLGFDPIGSGLQDPITQEWQYFTGKFDGLGHAISNLNVFRMPRNYVGLFGFVQGATIQNLTLTNVSVTGNESVGGLAGVSTLNNAGGSTFRNIHVSGSVNGTNRVGGLIGNIDSALVDRATSSADVGPGSEQSAGYGIGGIIGTATNSVFSNFDASGDIKGDSNVGGAIGSAGESTITNLTASGDIEIFSTGGGGAIGFGSGNFTNIHATGDVDGGQQVGGLIGTYQGNGTLQTATASGKVNGSNSVGGLIGRAAANITDATASGEVTGNQYVGGLAGQSNDTLSNVHATGNVFGGGNVGGLIGENHGDVSNSDATGNVQSEGDNVGGLIGFSEEANVSSTTASGTVTGANNVGGLIGQNKVGAVTNGQANGLVTGLGDRVGGLVGWNKMGGLIDSGSYTPSTISGVNYVGGLVGYNENGTVQNSNVATDVTGTGSRVGGLIGFSSGTVSTVYATGDVVGVNRVGGLIGENRSNINTAYATGLVTASGDFAGGLAGWSQSNITDSYATGVVQGISVVGGLAGYSDGAVTNVYANGNVTGTGEKVGGLIGEARGSLNSGSATGNVSGDAAVGGLIGENFAIVNTADTSGTVNGNTAVGGVAGGNWGILEMVQASGTVTSTGMYIGGIVGYNEAGALVRKGGSTGNISGGSNVGGIAGQNDGDLEQSTATGTVLGSAEIVGGLAGFNTGNVVGGSYTGESVTGANGVGGAVGVNFGVIDDITVSTAVSGIVDVGGLVGYTGGPEVKNSTISGTVTGTGDDVGGAIGGLDGSTVTNINTSAVVSGVNLVGGLIGVGGGLVTDSHATGAVSGNESVGGFIGESYAEIHDSTATGNVTGTGDNVGGFIGLMSEGLVDNSQADGVVTGGSYVGGFVGYLDVGQISGSTANGNVSGISRIGGFAGYNSEIITTSFAHGDVTGEYRVGGFVGRNSSSAEVSDSLADGDVTGLDEGEELGQIGGFAGANDGLLQSVTAQGNVTAASTADVGGLIGIHRGSVANSTASGNVIGAENVGGFIGHVYYDTDDDDVPVPAIISGATATGSVDGATAVGGLIGFNDLGKVGGSQASGAVTATANRAGGLVGRNNGSIDESTATSTVNGVGEVGGVVGFNDVGGVISATDASGVVSGQTSVGGFAGDNAGTINNANATGNVTATGDIAGGFVGRVSGAGQIADAVASGLVNGTTNTGGFAGYIDAGTGVQNSRSEGDVTGTTQVGGFFGYNAGTVNNSWTDVLVSGQEDVGGFGGYQAATGSVQKVYALGNVTVTGAALAASAGGLVGENAGSISVAYASGSVSGASIGADVGGLVGTQSGVITDAYATGAVSGSTNVGSLAGHISAGSITNAYGKGAVTATGSPAGGLIGLLAGGTVTNSYWNTASTGLTQGIGSTTGGSVIGGGGLDATQALWSSNYVGFDFTPGTGVWKNYDTDTTPLLTAWLTDLTITVNDAPITHVYNGSGWTDGVSNLTYSDPDAPTSGWLFGSARYNTGKNVGTYTDLVGLYSTQHGYNITFVNNGNLQVTPKAIEVTAAGINRVYDGTTVINANFGSTGILNGDVVTFTGVGNTLDKNVGTGKAVNVTGIAAQGADAGNYTFNTTAQTTADITKRSIEVFAQGVDRVYNGLTLVDVTFDSDGLVAGDSVSFTGVGNTLDKNVGKGKSVAVTNISGSGTDIGNYEYNTSTETWVDITKKMLDVGAQGVNRTYDGTTTVGVTYAPVGLIDGDDVTVSGGTGTMATKNAGEDKSVAVTGYTASGADLANYEYSETTETTVDIAKRELTVAGQATSRTYNGTTLVDVALTPLDLLDGDSASFTGVGNAVDKNVGVDKEVQITGITGTGPDLDNYTYNATATTGVDITKKVIVVDGQGINRAYNGTTLVDVTLMSTGIVAGDTLTFTGIGNTADKNVGVDKAALISGITGAGIDAGNYSYNITASTDVDISKKIIVVDALGINRAYDGTTAVGVTLTSGGVVTGDNLTFTGVGATADKNAGDDKAVAVSAITGAGEDLANYDFNSTAETTVDITKREIQVTGTGVDKTFDGTTAVTVNLSTTGLLDGDQLTFSGVGTAADRNAGQGKNVAISGIAGTGADLGNYSFNSTAQTTANVLPKAIQVSFQAPVVKIADGSVNAPLSSSNFAISGLVTGDSISVTKNLGQFADAQPGTGKTVSVQLNNADYVAQGNTVLGNYVLVNALLSGNFGQIQSSTTPAYEAVIATIPTNPANSAPSASNFSVISGAHGPAVSTGEADNGVSTESSGPTADGGIASVQTRESLIFRRTFSIADGGIRLPSGVAEDDSAQ